MFDIEARGKEVELLCQILTICIGEIRSGKFTPKEELLYLSQADGEGKTVLDYIISLARVSKIFGWDDARDMRDFLRSVTLRSVTLSTYEATSTPAQVLEGIIEYNNSLSSLCVPKRGSREVIIRVKLAREKLASALENLAKSVEEAFGMTKKDVVATLEAEEKKRKANERVRTSGVWQEQYEANLTATHRGGGHGVWRVSDCPLCRRAASEEYRQDAQIREDHNWADHISRCREEADREAYRKSSGRGSDW